MGVGGIAVDNYMFCFEANMAKLAISALFAISVLELLMPWPMENLFCLEHSKAAHTISARSCNGFVAAHKVCSVTLGTLITWQYLASVNWRNIAWLSSVMSFTAYKQRFFFKRCF